MTFKTSDQSDEKTEKDLPANIPTHLSYVIYYVPPLANTLKERSQGLVTFETFDQSDEMT